ncbi:MAG TPA: hypothetical protein PLJ78_10270 [Anaerolineae bacterium]|nr:hypothetical protein [Anaerolineae bacterium]HQK14313.1 hypothetical protein [Anaerolineae bacterium]
MTINNIEHANIVQWGCLALLIGGILLVIVTGLWLFSRPVTLPAGPRPTAIIWTVTPTPTHTPTPLPTPTPSPTLPLSPTEIGVGVRVRVSGTGAAGLNIRALPGTAAERLYIATEGEVFLVASGPTVADGFTWWFLRDEANPQREGWAVADYLVVAP